MLSPDQPCVVVPRFIQRAIGDEVFLLMFDSRIHWLKNATAKTVWDALVAAGPHGISPREATRRLVAEFEVDVDTALADVSAFMAALVDKGLVDSVDSNPPAA